MNRPSYNQASTNAFVLTIDLGNSAMQTTDDVADALRDVLIPLDNGGTYGVIRDANGNTVGRWDFNAPNDDQDQNS